MIDLKDHIDLFLQMLSIPAVSREERARADFLEQTLSGQGLTVKRVHNNLVIAGGNDPKAARILLNSHIDTVPAADGWTRDPFKPLQENGKITALGSNDAGASAMGLLAAYKMLKDSEDHGDVVLVLSAEEEVSGALGIASVLPELPALEFAVVGEPTGMQPAVAERGLMVIDAVASGKAGHAARNEGENAISKALADIAKLQDLQLTEKSSWLSDPAVNVTMIQAGQRHNMIPGVCDFVIDVRSNDRYSNERLLEILRKNTLSELRPRSLRLGSSALEEGHPVFQAIGELGMTPFGSPTLSDMAQIDVPAIKIGPGESARSHTANEYIFEKELEHGIETYYNLITKLLKIEL